jgi:hypothetical protein
MEVDHQPQTLLGPNGPSETETETSTSTPFDLVGGSFAVIESDPGLVVPRLLFFNNFMERNN